MYYFWHFWPIFVHSKCKRSSLRSSMLNATFLRFSNTVYFGSFWNNKNLYPLKSIVFAFSTSPNYIFKIFVHKIQTKQFSVYLMPLHPWMKLHFAVTSEAQFLPRCHTMQLTQFSLIVGKATGKNRVSYSISFSCKMRWFSQWRQKFRFYSLC